MEEKEASNYKEIPKSRRPRLSQAISQNRLNRMTYYTVTVMQEIWEGEQ